MKMRSTFAMACVLLAGCDRGNIPQQLGEKAPDFIVTRDGATVSLAQYRGRTVILNFWATWCAPCIQELPSLQELQKQMPQVQVLAVSIDDDGGAYRDFIRDNHVTLTSVRDGSEGANLKFGSVRVPETFVVDRNGMIRRKFIGAQQWTSPEIIDYLKKL